MFSVKWVPKHLLPPVKIRTLAPKEAKFGPKYVFLVILSQILAVFGPFSPIPDRKTMQTRCLYDPFGAYFLYIIIIDH